MRNTKVSDDYYGVLMIEYKQVGFSMLWTMKDNTDIMIKDMKDSHIKNCIGMLNRNTLTETRRAWIDILTDVQLKRRELKLEKIKEKINNAKSNI